MSDFHVLRPDQPLFLDTDFGQPFACAGNMDASLNYTASNGTWNISVEQFLLENLGPRRKDTVSAIVLSIVYLLIFLSGSMGNICTCVVIVRNHCMQTTTNYYLFSLAISDLMLLFFGLPPEMFTIWMAYPWRFGEAFCYLRPTILELTSYASVLTITAFTVERYIAVCKPLLSHKIAVLSRSVKIIVCLWIVSLLASLPYAAHTRLYHAVTWPPTGQPVADSLVCSIPEKWLEGRMTYMFQVSTFLFFLAPVTLIICLYILIGIAVRRSPLSRGSSDEQSNTYVKNTPLPQQPRRVVIRMLVAVTVAFIICWAPFHTQRLMVLYVRRWTPELLAAQSHIFYISGVLYFVSSTVNPILYNVISRRYRVAFKQTIFGPCSKHKTGTHRQHFSSNNQNRPLQQDDLTYFHQRHSLLGKDSPYITVRRSTNLTIRSDLSDKKTPRKDDVKGPSQRMEHVASSLCLDFLRCSKVRTDAAAVAKGTASPQHEDTQDFNDGYRKLHCFQTQNAKKLSSLCSENGRAKMNSEENCKPSPSDLSVIGRNDAQSSGKGGGSPYQKYQVILSDISDNSDPNYNSESDSSKVKEISDKIRTAVQGVQQADTPLLAQPSHQHGVSKTGGVTMSLCKQCLTHNSALKGNTTCNDVDAYRVRYNVNKPLTLV